MATADTDQGLGELGAPLAFPADDIPEGRYLSGVLLGRKPASTWTPDGETKPRAIGPKMGLRIAGEPDVSIAAGSEEALNEALRGFVKGDRIMVRVQQTVSSFNGRATVRTALYGTPAADTGWQ